MGAAWQIAVKDLKLRLRDRSVFIIGLIAPLALAFVFNLVFGGSINDVGEQVTFSLGVAVQDDGELGSAFLTVLRELEEEGLIELTEFASDTAATSAAGDGDVGAAFLVPAGASDALREGDGFDIGVVGDVDAPTTTDVAAAIARRFAAGVERANLSALAVVANGVVPAAEFADLAAAAGAEPPLIEVGEVQAEVRQLDPATYFVAGLSVFFIFFIAGLSVSSMLEERRDGTLSRLIAAPISRASIIGGKSLTSIIIGVGALTVLVIASRFLMGAEWGPPLGVAMMVGAAVLAVVGVMTLVGGLAKTPEQAGNLQSVVAVTFAMLGGTFVPIANSQGLLARLQYLTPNAWFIRGLADMSAGDVSAGLAPAGVLLVFAVVTGTLGATVVGKAVRP
jgi:ABC-2 type transport system permease protein